MSRQAISRSFGHQAAMRFLVPAGRNILSSLHPQHNMQSRWTTLTALLLWSGIVWARCYDPSPAFPLPKIDKSSKRLDKVFASIDRSLQEIIKDEKFDGSSYSVEVTSQQESLWSSHHTAKIRNETRPGAEVVDGESLYRIASITKTFTVLGILQQHAAGNLSLDDSIDQYIPEFQESQNGTIPWKDITLRILASQLSGIPRDFAQADLINEFDDPTVIGLPPASKEGLLSCDEYAGWKPCTRKELIDSLKNSKPVLAPNQESTYSNLAFELLGLVIQNVTGMDYSHYIEEAIFKPLKMTGTSLEKPSDLHAVLPVGENYWDREEGIQRPTGGIYSSTTDMSKFLRYILTHYNALATGVNWMQPASWSTGMQTFYGMPWEIFRTDEILDSNRPVTFVTKGGGLPGYFSHIIVAPEYGVAFTILAAGIPPLEGKIREVVTVAVIRVLEELAWEQVTGSYSGSFVAVDEHLNSSIVLHSDAKTGLSLASFISNGTDVLNTVIPSYAAPDIQGGSVPWHAQLTPTLLYKNETAMQGEIWRMTVVIERNDSVPAGVWDRFCNTDIDLARYAGLPINELVFWEDKEYDLEMPAWRLKLKRVDSGNERVALVEQMQVSGFRSELR